jgi:hypothetical protein
VKSTYIDTDGVVLRIRKPSLGASKVQITYQVDLMRRRDKSMMWTGMPKLNV